MGNSNSTGGRSVGPRRGHTQGHHTGSAVRRDLGTRARVPTRDEARPYAVFRSFASTLSSVASQVEAIRLRLAFGR
eukprot:6083983-Lingulodinium_polyedra.AAC.1